MIQNKNAETYMLYILDLGDCWKKDYVNYTKRFYLEYLNSAMKDLALWLSAEPKKQSSSPPFVPAECISLQFYLNLEQGLRQSMANWY